MNAALKSKTVWSGILLILSGIGGFISGQLNVAQMLTAAGPGFILIFHRLATYKLAAGAEDGPIWKSKTFWAALGTIATQIGGVLSGEMSIAVAAPIAIGAAGTIFQRRAVAKVAAAGAAPMLFLVLCLPLLSGCMAYKTKSGGQISVSMMPPTATYTDQARTVTAAVNLDTSATVHGSVILQRHDGQALPPASVVTIDPDPFTKEVYFTVPLNYPVMNSIIREKTLVPEK